MVLIQLKMPPERLAAIIKSVEHTIDDLDPGRDRADLIEIRDWLRYRHTLWLRRKRTRSDV